MVCHVTATLLGYFIRRLSYQARTSSLRDSQRLRYSEKDSTYFGDVSARLFQRQGKAPQIARKRSSLFSVSKCLLPSRLGALQQERSSIFFVEHVEFDGLNRGAPVGDARSDDHLPTLELRKRFLYFSCGFRRVGVVENQEPAGMLAEPAEHGGQARDFLGLVPFGQIKDQRIAKRRKIRAQVDRGASTNKEQRSLIITRMAPRVFDCKARFAHASQSMDRLASVRPTALPPRHESLPQIGQCGVATFKERAEGVVRKVNHSARCLRTAGWEPQFPDSACEVLVVGKRVINVAALLDGVPVGKLQVLFLRPLRGEFIGLAVLSSEKQVKRFPEFPRYVVFDLGVRAARLARLDAAAVPPRSKSRQGGSRRHTRPMRARNIRVSGP